MLTHRLLGVLVGKTVAEAVERREAVAVPA
jgi:hypothetical protein